MHVPQNIKDRVDAQIEKSYGLAEAHYGRTFPRPAVDYNVRGHTAGYARGDRHVSFNSILLMENIDAFIADIVIHECAHCVDYQVNPHNHNRAHGRKRNVHGADWKRVMRIMGGNPTRCHKFDTTNAAVRKKVRHEWICNDCGATMKLGPRRHAKQMKAESYRPSGKGCAWTHTYRYVGIEGAQVPPKAASAPKSVKVPTPGARAAKDVAREAYARNATRGSFINDLVAGGIKKTTASTYWNNFKTGAWV